MPEYIPTPGDGAAVDEKTTVKRPKRYKVLLLNDNYTTMDFVVDVLMQVFGKSPEMAERIMMAVHKQGRGVAGVYPKDVAEAKILATHKRARDSGFPLRCDLESE